MLNIIPAAASHVHGSIDFHDPGLSVWREGGEKKPFLHSDSLPDSCWCVFSDCSLYVQTQKEGSTKKLPARGLNCHCLLLKIIDTQDRYVIWSEIIFVSLLIVDDHVGAS